MSTFYDKQSYTISLCMLKYCLQKGLKLKKVHHVIYAKQFCEIFYEILYFNNEKITECSINNNKFGVDQSKLMNSSIFCKHIENPKKYKDTRIANNEVKLRK